MEITDSFAASEAQQKEAFEVCQTAFGFRLSENDAKAWKECYEIERTLVARDGDAPVGSGANISFDLTIPGGTVAAAGVTLIGVLPSHRRRGILRQMMKALHDDAVRRAEPLAALWASEGNIYQRFGYGLATRGLWLNAQRDRTFFINDPGPVGRMRIVPVDEASKLIAPVYERVRLATPGMYARSETWWKYHTLHEEAEEHEPGQGPPQCALLEIDGRAEGYALYRLKPGWESYPTGVLNVYEAMGTGPVATRELWRYLFGVDLIETVRAWWLPLDHPLLLQVAEPRRLGMRVMDALWVRILDLQAALRARSYAAADSITIEVTDGDYPDNEGTWTIDTTGDNVEIRRAAGFPDLRCDIRDVGAAYLGGTSFAELLGAARLDEVTDNATARLDALFGTGRAPWSPEVF
jgi:predicted acetyltransferase